MMKGNALRPIMRLAPSHQFLINVIRIVDRSSFGMPACGILSCGIR